MSSWYMNSTCDSDVVVSTRIRLARNLQGIPFPAKMTEPQRKELTERVKNSLKDSNTPFSNSLKFIDMSAVPENEIGAMVERHIISPEFAASNKHRAIILSDDESISIMVGEEDHLRIQVLLEGLQLEKAYDIAEQLDSILHASLHFAFDSNLGYLTECPTNLGTGLRASVMLHLPVCEQSGEISVISDTIGKIGFTVRGMYGEGSRSSASLYQISNQITLGINEKSALDNLKIIIGQIAEKERNATKNIDSLVIEDKAYRALGTLKNSRILSGREMMNLLSLIKLGKTAGIIKEEINTMGLLIEGQPHMLMKKYGEMSPEERDICRATALREATAKL